MEGDWLSECHKTHITSSTTVLDQILSFYSDKMYAVKLPNNNSNPMFEKSLIQTLDLNKNFQEFNFNIQESYMFLPWNAHLNSLNFPTAGLIRNNLFYLL